MLLAGRCTVARRCCRCKPVLAFLVGVFLVCACVNVLWQVYPDATVTTLWLRGQSVDVERLLAAAATLDFSAPDWDRPRCGAVGCDVNATTAAAQRRTVRSRTGLDCDAMFRGDEAEMARAADYMNAHRPEVIGRAEYLNATRNCAAFRRSRGYFSRPASRGEAEFPIAFSILAYKDVHQVERLLRAVYAPQNFYCIHVDAKCPAETLLAFRAIAGCFENVFVASTLESVFWGHISIVLAEMRCLEDLVKYRWRYFINLSGQMFPTHSNAELVRILRLYDGANDVEGSYKRSAPVWLQIRNVFRWRHSTELNMMLMTMYLKGRAPYNVTIYKGSNQVVLTRAFVLYFLYSRTSQDLVEWFADTMAPDEYIWPTLNHNPALRAPGSYKGDPETKVFTARATIWTYFAKQIDWSWKHWQCRGKWVREICIFGVGDLPWLGNRPELFVNKFHGDFQWLGYDCMEERTFNRTVRPHQYARLDLSYYENLSIVRDKTVLVTSVNETLDLLRRRS